MQAPIPANEDKRLLALHRYDILDTPVEDAFERITRLAAKIFQAPIALTTLVDRDRQWFKSCYGLDTQSTTRQISFCAHTILSESVMTVPDTYKDKRFADNPQVIGSPGFRFYAGAPLRTPDGYNLGTLCILDRIPRRQLNAEEEETLVDLAALVIDELELRNALSKAQREINRRKNAEVLLQETNLKLETADRAKSFFLSTTSHELRTPLGAIIGFSELLTKEAVGSLNQQQRNYAQYIFDSGNHLLSLVNDILDLSKIEAGKMKLYLELVDLTKFVRSAIPVLQEKFLEKGVSLKVKVPEIPYQVLADQRKLRQILYNLLANALKFTPPGGVVTISANSYPDYICLSIKDSGVGISAEEQLRLFQPFVQLNQDNEGTGLGLAITKRLLELHNGSINVESSVGKGSTFRFQLPRPPLFQGNPT